MTTGRAPQIRIREDAAKPSRRFRSLAITTVAIVEVVLMLGLLAFVQSLSKDLPIGSAVAILMIGAFALSVLAYAFLHRNMIDRLHRLRTRASTAQRARAEAEAASQEKSQLLATMSHEIRTPLNGVIGMLDLMLETDLTAEQKNYAKLAHASGRTLLSMIDEILDTAKSEALKSGESDSIDVVALVENVTELLAPRAHAKGIDISSHIEMNVPQFVTGDDLGLRRVLFNLAGNAIKFTERGGVAIEVQRSNSNGICLTVRDSGIGMTQDELRRIFGAYAQANETTNRRFGGTGLGLSISRKTIETMGGNLAAESVSGTGSTFTATLPKVIADAAIADVALPLTGRCYHLALQNDVSADHLARSLTALGAELRTSKDGTDWMRELANFSTVQICDPQSAPAVLAAAGKLLKRGAVLPQIWIMLTPEDRRPLRHLLREPVTGYLLKPLRRATLVNQLTAHDGKLVKAASSELRALARRGGSRAPLRVLLADDTPVNALIARTILEKAGHVVVAVNSGRAALAEIDSKKKFDILLLDLEMPELDGLATARLIRAAEAADPARPRLPILALTANTRSEAVTACRQAGMDGYLSKPFDRQDLEEKIVALAAKRAA